MLRLAGLMAGYAALGAAAFTTVLWFSADEGTRNVAGLPAGFLVAFVLILAGFAILTRSYLRNSTIYGRPPLFAGLVAAAAVMLWPITLWYWLAGPTPERSARRG